jgi:hypothetical protein
VADRVYEQIFAGNPRGLYEMTMPDDRNTLGWTPETVDRLVRWAGECFKGYKVVGPRIDKKTMLNGLLTEVHLQGPDGETTMMQLVCYNFPEGPKCYLDQIVPVALYAKYIGREPKGSKTRSEEAWARALHAEAPILETFGPGGLRGNLPQGGNKLYAWNDQLRSANAFLKIMKDHYERGVPLPWEKSARRPAQ